MLKRSFQIKQLATVLLILLCGTAFSQNKLSCPYSIANYLNRTICFNYEIKGSVYGQDCKTLHEGFACLAKSENGQPTYWQLDTLCASATDILITIKTCGGCTLNPRIDVSGHCEEARIDSSHTPCCRMLHLKWDRKQTQIF